MGERLEQIRERLEAATDGPWRADAWLDMKGLTGQQVRGVTRRGGVDRDEKKDRRIAVATWDPGTHRDQTEGNAAFIAHAPTDLRYLLNRIEAQAEVVEAAREAVWALKEARAFVEAIPATTSKELDRRQRRLAEALDNLEEQTDD